MTKRTASNYIQEMLGKRFKETIDEIYDDGVDCTLDIKLPLENSMGRTDSLDMMESDECSMEVFLKYRDLYIKYTMSTRNMTHNKAVARYKKYLVSHLFDDNNLSSYEIVDAVGQLTKSTVDSVMERCLHNGDLFVIGSAPTNEQVRFSIRRYVSDNDVENFEQSIRYMDAQEIYDTVNHELDKSYRGDKFYHAIVKRIQDINILSKDFITEFFGKCLNNNHDDAALAMVKLMDEAMVREIFEDNDWEFMMEYIKRCESRSDMLSSGTFAHVVEIFEKVPPKLTKTRDLVRSINIYLSNL